MVSIIVPNYNHSKYLKERIESILAQTYTDYECILLDDASTDNSIAILSEYTKRDKRFKLFSNKINTGSTFAQWNYGVTLAQRKYIWIAESDDYSDPDFLRILVYELECNPQVVLAYSQSNLVDSVGNKMGLWSYDSSIFLRNFKMNGNDFIYYYMLNENSIPNASAVVFRRSVYLDVGNAIFSLKNNGDWHLWLKILTKGNITYYSDPLNYYRQHNASVTYKARQNILNFGEFDKQIILLRKEYDSYLSSLKDSVFEALRKKNHLLISYEWGAYGLFLRDKHKYLGSIYFIIKASFYPRFKSYYLKKYIFGCFYNNLFQRSGSIK